MKKWEYITSSSSSSPFLGLTAQLRPWPPPQNPAEFLGGFSTIFFLQGRVVSPTPNPHPGGPGLCIYIPQRQGGYLPVQFVAGTLFHLNKLKLLK
jgi:hypothetical protein